jgi:hypothetical protein
MALDGDLPPRLVRIGNAIIDVKRIAYISEHGETCQVHFVGCPPLEVEREKGQDVFDSWKDSLSQKEDSEGDEWKA